MSSMKSFFRPLIKKNDVIVISDDEDEQDSRDTNVPGGDLIKPRRSSNTESEWSDESDSTPPLREPETIDKQIKVTEVADNVLRSDESNSTPPIREPETIDKQIKVTEVTDNVLRSDESNSTPPLREPETEPETRGTLSSSLEPETRCTSSSGVDKLDSETSLSSSEVDELDSETSLSSSEVDELDPETEKPSSSRGIDKLYPETEQPSSSRGIDKLDPETEQPSSSRGIDKLICETEPPALSGAIVMECESRHPSSLEIEEPCNNTMLNLLNMFRELYPDYTGKISAAVLITPVPVNEGETFNRAEYQVPPQLVSMSEQSNKVVVEFLSACMPHVTQGDRPLILRKIKDLLNKTNKHYLLSDRFHQTVASIVTSVQKNSSSANVYLRIKELADELRSRQERKSKQKGTFTSGPLNDSSSASSAAVSGSSGEDTSDGNCGIPAISEASDTVASQARVSAWKSLAPSSTIAVADSTSVAQTETSATAGKKDFACESQKLVGADHDEKWSNGAGSMGETSGVSQKSEQQLRTDRCIKKLENHLIKLHKAIKDLHKEEVDLTCEDSDSAYILEGRLKDRAVAVWRKICELEQRRPITGCEQEKKFHYKGSRYHQINTGVEKLINKNRMFPDFRDILDVVQKENQAHSLGLNSKQEKHIAEEVFQEVGKELQKRRQRDELADALAYLEDGPGADFMDDPAESDRELLQKLESNAKLCQRKIDEVIEVYVAKQEEMKLEAKYNEQDNCDVSPTLSDGSGSDDDDEDDNDDDLSVPRESLLENDASLSESPVEQEETEQDPQQGNQDICYLSSASNNSSEDEDSEDEREDLKNEDMMSTERDFLGNDRSSCEDGKEEEPDAKEEPDAGATCRVHSPVTVEDRESSARSLADGDSHSIVKGGPPVEERADCRDNALATGLDQKSLLPGTETSSGARGSHKEVPQLPTKKQECSLKKRSAPEPEVITILSDDEDVYEPSHPPAKVPKLCQRTNL